MWYIYTVEYYSAIKKSKILPFVAMWMNLDIITKWSKSDKDKYDITYMLNLKNKWYKWTYLQNRNRFTDFKNKLIVTKGESWGGSIN